MVKVTKTLISKKEQNLRGMEKRFKKMLDENNLLKTRISFGAIGISKLKKEIKKLKKQL